MEMENSIGVEADPIMDIANCLLEIKEKEIDNELIPYVPSKSTEEWYSIRDDLYPYESTLIDDLNIIYSKNRDIHFKLLEDAFIFSFSPLTRMIDPAISIIIQSGDNFFLMEMDSSSGINLLDGECADELPVDIKCAMAESVLEPLLDQFDKWAGVKSHIREVMIQASEKKFEFDLAFTITRIRDAFNLSGRISTMRSGIEWLAVLMLKLPDTHMKEIDTIPIHIGFAIGSTKIPLRDLRTIETDDIIVLDECVFYPESANCRVKLSADLYWEGTLNKNNILTIQSFAGGIMGGKNAENSVIEPEIIEHIEELDVEIVFELGRKKVTIGQLKKIKAGYTFDLEKELNNSASLIVNGKIIGTGEIVRIDEQIGVKITAIRL